MILCYESPKFSRFYMRQMRAEELYESLLTQRVLTKVMDYESGRIEITLARTVCRCFW